jgi:hypothetical protein
MKTLCCTSLARLGSPSRSNIAWSFDTMAVGDYTVDLLVGHVVLVELKVAEGDRQDSSRCA